MKVVIAVLAVGITIAGVLALNANDTDDLVLPAQLTIHLDETPTQLPPTFAQTGTQQTPTPAVIEPRLCDTPPAARRTRQELC